MTGPDGDALRMRRALDAIRTLRARVEELERGRSQPVAVIGMGCRFPSAPDPDAYWRLLRDGVSAIRDVPADRWDVAAYYDPEPGASGRMYTRRGGFLDGVDAFDAAFFGISPREARSLDPQQRLLLEVGWEALERSGLDPRRLAGSRTGVFVGIAESEYLQLLRGEGADPVELYDLTGTTNSMAGGRLAYHLDLRGPNVAIDTACSSALVAVHLATASLRGGEADLALAGGVNLMLTPEAFVSFCSAGALAADGCCKAFDGAADGYGRGEGCGIVVLKRLADALRDGDPVLAVIRGTAVNQDGRTNGLTAPNGRAQQAVIRQALADAGLAPADVGYVETHGAGTPLGDPIEAHALAAVFGDRTAPLAIGAAKTNVGHLEAAAGAAGLIKAVLVLQHGEIPPNLHFREPNPHIPWAELPLAVPVERRPWPAGFRAAGVSSFGFSGTNAHVVLERAPEPAAAVDGPDRPYHVLTLSARTPDALRELAARTADALAGADAPPLADACFTANTGRARFAHRLAAVAPAARECADRLAAFAADGSASRLAVGQAAARPGVAFLFTGQGSQYAGMGERLFATHPGFRATLQRCDEVLRDTGLLERPLLQVLYPPPGSDAAGEIDRTVYAQPALFALEYALAELWRSWGVEPRSVLGHSTGEYAAACVAGAFGLEDGLALVARRARLIAEATAGGATAAVFAGADAVAEMLAALDGQVSVAGLNGPRETLIAGPAGAVESALAALKARGVDGRALRVPHAPHSAMVDAVLDDFEAAARRVSYLPPRVQLISNVTGGPVAAVDAAHWRRHLRQPVRFAEAMEALAAEPCGVVLEVGPQPVLQLLGRQSWRGPAVRWLSSLWAGHDDWRQVLQCAAELHASGVDLDWAALDRGHARRKVVLPTYPFQRSRHWFNRRDAGEAPAPAPAASVPAGADREARIREELRERVAIHLELETAQVEPSLSLVELGADSLLMARLVQDVQDRYGVAVGIGRLFDDLDSVAALARHLDGVTGDEPRPVEPAARALDPEQRRHVETLVERYVERTAASRRRAAEHGFHRADTRVAAFRPETGDAAYPIVAERAAGARFRDVDGNEYVDLAMGIGVLLCGHWPDFVAEAVRAQADRALQTGPVSDLADEVAAMLCAATGTERALFTVTGTDAVKAALRVAQAATGRSRFAMFAGSYHGQDDRVLAVPDVLGDPLRSLPAAPGVSPRAAADALVLTYGDRRSLATIEARADELAAVLVEPVQSRNPALQPREFLVELRALTRRLGIPLVFDEVITGFRVHPRGAQGWFGVEADIAAYGKCLGAGLPIGVVAGRAEYLDRVDGGRWVGVPGGRPAVETTYLGSTFEMHPLALAAARAMLRHFQAEGPALQEELNRRAAGLADRLNELFRREQAPIRVVRFASIFRFTWRGNASYAHQPLEIELFHLHLLERGVYLWEGRTCFLSTAHTDGDLDHVVAAAAEAVADLRAGGFLPAAPATLPLSDEQRELLRLRAGAEPGGPDWTVADDVLLRGPFDLDACRRAVRALVERHEALRTAFEPDGARVATGAADVVAVDLGGEPLAAWWRRELARPFDLAAGPPFRVFAVRLAGDVHHLALVAHHLVSDGWSSTVLLQELAALYTAERTGTPAALGPALQQRDFVRWQEEQRMADHLTYWRERFPEGLPATGPPADRAAPQPLTHRGDRVSFRVEPALFRDVVTAGRAHRCTPFMTLLAAFGLLVHRLSGRREIVVGTPTAGRAFPGSDTIVGYCTHLLPIRSRTADTIADYVRALRETVLEAYAHQDLPFARLRAALDADGPPFPLRTIFNLDRSIPCPSWHGLAAEVRPVPAVYALVDLRMDAIESDGGLWIDCDYRTDLFGRDTVSSWCALYHRLLVEIVLDGRAAEDTP